MTVCPVPTGALLDGFCASLDRDRVAGWVQEHLLDGARLQDMTPSYVRFKEQDGCLVAWRLVLSEDGGELLETYLTVRSAPEWRLRNEADRLTQRIGEQWRHLRSLALLAEEGVLLLAFPVDRVLADLRRMVRASKVRNLLLQHAPGIVPGGLRPSKSRSSCRVVRYKPERRAVLHWSIGMVDEAAGLREHTGVYVRVYSEVLGGRARAAQEAARRGGIRCPGVLALPHGGLLVEPELPGRPWQGLDQAGAAGGLLARLHACGPPAKLGSRTPLGQLDSVLRACEDLRRLEPELGARAAALADRLSLRVPPATPARLLHGDFHRGQLLFEGEAAGVVDFDRAAGGPPAMDLADFWAHEVLHDPRQADPVTAALEAGYAETAELPPEAERNWYRLAALLRVAMTPFRRLHAQWPAEIAALLDRAEEVAEELPA